MRWIAALVLGSCLLTSPSTKASVIDQNADITYNFAGTLNRPINGIDTFSGLLVINGPDFSTNRTRGTSYDFATAGAQLSIDIGGHSITIGFPGWDHWDVQNTGLRIVHGGGYDEFSSFADKLNNDKDAAFFGKYVHLKLLFVNAVGTALPENSPNVLQDLDMDKFQSRTFVIGSKFGTGAYSEVQGTLTSWINTANAVPEPSTFTLLAVGITSLALRSGLRRHK